MGSSNIFHPTHLNSSKGASLYNTRKGAKEGSRSQFSAMETGEAWWRASARSRRIISIKLNKMWKSWCIISLNHTPRHYDTPEAPTTTDIAIKVDSPGRHTALESAQNHGENSTLLCAKNRRADASYSNQTWNESGINFLALTWVTILGSILRTTLYESIVWNPLIVWGRWSDSRPSMVVFVG